MIKVSALYPRREGARFDAGYYVDKHVPLVLRLLGSAVKGHSVDRGLASASGGPPPFLLAAHFLFDSVDSFRAAFGAHAGTIMADLPNYSDIEPTIYVSEVLR
jgi:uncharacterized protein (TIGR02118 family)